MSEARGSGVHGRYLVGLGEDHRALLARLNEPGLERLKALLNGGKSVAVLGAGASVPLYPLWVDLIGELVDGASARLTEEAAATCRAMAGANPDAVVEILRRLLGPAEYREVLRRVFRPRRDETTGRTWTPTQELVARCNFAGVVTTNYDPGIVNVRMAVRPSASGTGFASWTDDDALDRWRTGDVFGDEELPVLFAHGHHNQPDAMVLATTEYRKAYDGKVGRVLARIVDERQLVWIGFSFTDQRITAILREVGQWSGTRSDPGRAPRHVAVIPWDPASVDRDAPDSPPHDPSILRSLIEIQFDCRAVLYPAPAGDHSALQALLEECTDARFPPAPPIPTTSTNSLPVALDEESEVHANLVERWVHGGTPVASFTGRVEELSRLDRWAADPSVRLVGVTAWGGSGKTALITEWLTQRKGAACRPVVRGTFAWSFYEDSSAESWATALLEWVQQTFDLPPGSGALANRILAAVRAVPLVLVLDGLEVTQEGAAGSQFGRLLDGTLRTVLTTLCAADHPGLVILTSRFPFADLEQFDGGAARMLDVPQFTPAEGAELLATVDGCGWLSEPVRQDLARAVDGHALAVSVLGGLLADRSASADVSAMLMELQREGRTDARVTRVLGFYADRLSEADRKLVGLVSLFQRPVTTATVLTLGADDTIGAPLANWDRMQVETAVRQRLTGLLTWHFDGRVSGHPLVRDAFRPLVLTKTAAQHVSDVALADLPAGGVTSREDALCVVEMIELMLDAGSWEAADDLFNARALDGRVWRNLPAAQLGQRCASAFVATEARQREFLRHLPKERLAFYFNGLGLAATNAGDLATGEQYLRAAVEENRQSGRAISLSITLQNLCTCLMALGDVEGARTSALDAYEHATGDFRSEITSVTYLAIAFDLGGATLEADREFLRAAVLQHEAEPGVHLYSSRGCSWADFLLRTGRMDVARALTAQNREICERNRWNEDVASCERVLAACDVADGNFEDAGDRLARAAATFRDGNYLSNLGIVLTDLSQLWRRMGDLDEAERLATEVVALVGPRMMVPVHGRALAARACIRADRFGMTGDRREVERARDDADLVLRLATRTRRLPWLELAAAEAHAQVDAVEERVGEWIRKADLLRAALLSSEVDSTPLATVEGAVTATKPGLADT